MHQTNASFRYPKLGDDAALLALDLGRRPCPPLVPLPPDGEPNAPVAHEQRHRDALPGALSRRGPPQQAPGDCLRGGGGDGALLLRPQRRHLGGKQQEKG